MFSSQLFLPSFNSTEVIFSAKFFYCSLISLNLLSVPIYECGDANLERCKLFGPRSGTGMGSARQWLLLGAAIFSCYLKWFESDLLCFFNIFLVLSP